MAKVIFKTAVINLPVINFQFDETHLTEITKEVNEVLGKQNMALSCEPFKYYANFNNADLVIAKYAADLRKAGHIYEVSQASYVQVDCKTLRQSYALLLPWSPKHLS